MRLEQNIQMRGRSSVGFGCSLRKIIQLKIVRRHHLYETGIQRAIKKARIEAGVYEHVTPHTFRHCFATHLLQDGYSIRMVQELLGHEDVKTTMIYTHCMLPAGEAGIVSPLDKMFLADVI